MSNVNSQRYQMFVVSLDRRQEQCAVQIIWISRWWQFNYEIGNEHFGRPESARFLWIKFPVCIQRAILTWYTPSCKNLSSLPAKMDNLASTQEAEMAMSVQKKKSSQQCSALLMWSHHLTLSFPLPKRDLLQSLWGYASFSTCTYLVQEPGCGDSGPLLLW